MDDISRYYEILGLKVVASEDEIKQAYRDLVKVWHPDRFAHDPPLQKKADETEKDVIFILREAKKLGVSEAIPKYGRFLIQETKKVSPIPSKGKTVRYKVGGR